MPLEFTHACSARGGFSSCVNREVGLGSHSLSHSSPAPNNPYGFCGRKAPPKKKFSSSLICGTSIPRSRGPMNTIRHARGPRCRGPMNTIRHARGPRCRGPDEHDQTCERSTLSWPDEHDQTCERSTLSWPDEHDQTCERSTLSWPNEHSQRGRGRPPGQR